MSWSLHKRCAALFLLGSLLLVLLYSTAGLKAPLACIVLTPAVRSLVLGRRIPFGVALTWLAAAAVAFVTLVVTVKSPIGKFELMLGAIVLARIFGGPGLLTAQYHDFFAAHPLTYYSHVSGINQLVAYPYGAGLGHEVGYFYSGNLDLNVNAHFWCTDGIAALGMAGVLVASGLCAIVLWVLDSVAVGHPPEFSAAAVTMTALQLANVSLFTTLLSCGLMFLGLMLYLMPRDLRKTDNPSVSQQACAKRLLSMPRDCRRTKWA